MALVRFTRVLPDKKETEVSINPDWVQWAQSDTTQTVLLKMGDGMDVIVKGKLEDIEKMLDV
jgi:hypothetical protein